MTQPSYVPVAEADQVRPAYRLSTPRIWTASRPGDPVRPAMYGRGYGHPGPDQGFAMRLIQRFHDRLVLGELEREEDALAVGVALAMRRAGEMGRAPVLRDCEHALVLLGYLPVAPAGMAAWRAPLVAGAAHDAWRRQRVVDLVRPEALRLGLDELRHLLAASEGEQADPSGHGEAANGWRSVFFAVNDRTSQSPAQ